MSETTLLLTVKMQPSFNWKALTKLVCGRALTIAVVSFPNIALALNVQDVPNPKQSQNGWVTDMANVLSSETEADINRLLSNLEATNGSEIAVVTVPETTPSATPKEFATALFNYWGIGKKGRDNGVLLLIAKGDRRVEIETGYGVEDVLSDALVGNIINQQITPAFKQGNFDKGTLNGTKALVTVLEAEARNLNPDSEGKIANSNPQNLGSIEQNSQDGGWAVFLGLLGLSGGILAIALVGRKGKLFQKVVEPIVKLCSTCQQPMTKIDSKILHPHLNQPQQVAQKLGSVDFEGWHCINCYLKQHSLKEVHLERHRLPSSRFRYCPVCQEFTVTHTSKVIKPATVFSEGTSLEVGSCNCCSYQKETEKTINKLPPPPPPPTKSSSTNIWINNGGSSGGYSGGGDWGGGSSGGGGAGGSW